MPQIFCGIGLMSSDVVRTSPSESLREAKAWRGAALARQL